MIFNSKEPFKVPPYLVNSVQLRQGFPRQFDAHIYFEISQLNEAILLRAKAIENFQHPDIFIGDIIGEPIGPHVLPMFEINFSNEYLTPIVLWLMHERGNLPVLIHALTGNEYYDHTQTAIWMGKMLPLRYETLQGFESDLNE